MWPMNKKIWAVEVTLFEIDADVDDYGATIPGTTPSKQRVMGHYDGSRTKGQAFALYEACDALFKKTTEHATKGLLAAAPDLLAACKLALEQAGELQGATRRGRIRDAIAKAEGVAVLCLGLLAFASPVQASWDLKPYAVLIAGQMADVTTTVHQINTPALHCREANPLFGAHPSTMKLLLPKVAVVAGVSLFMRLAEVKGTRAGRNVAKAVGYALGAMGATAAGLNVRTCGW
jgi:hypothetical protein